MGAVIAYTSSATEHVLPLGDDTILVGTTAGATIRTADPTVTRRHARIYLHAGRHWIEDLGSDNGTYANGTRVQRHALRDGDRLQCGRLVLSYNET